MPSLWCVVRAQVGDWRSIITGHVLETEIQTERGAGDAMTDHKPPRPLAHAMWVALNNAGLLHPEAGYDATTLLLDRTLARFRRCANERQGVCRGFKSDEILRRADHG